jgi:hypothetical protein
MILTFGLINSPNHVLKGCVNRIYGHFFVILNFIQGHCVLPLWMVMFNPGYED